MATLINLNTCMYCCRDLLFYCVSLYSVCYIMHSIRKSSNKKLVPKREGKICALSEGELGFYFTKAAFWSRKTKVRISIGTLGSSAHWRIQKGRVGRCGGILPKTFI